MLHNPPEGEDRSPEKVYKEEVGPWQSETAAIPPLLLNKVDGAIQCEVSWWQDAELERSPESSPEGNRKGTVRKLARGRQLDEKEVRAEQLLQESPFLRCLVGSGSPS